jgi:hypothetical protein
MPRAKPFKHCDDQFDAMVLALAVWLCSLPLVALIVIPSLGLKAAGVIALSLLLIALAVCWRLCSWKRLVR